MKHLLFALLLLPATVLHAQVPQLLNYQGRVVVGTVNFNGSGQFKFALVNAAGTATYWSNDGTSTAGSQPTAAVTLTVTKGLYSVLLGDTALANMTAIPSSVFANPDVRLRVWFNDGTNGSQLLTPDQRLAPNGYLPDAAVTTAKIASGAVGSTQLAAGAVGSSQLATGAVQAGSIAAGAVGASQIANGAVGSAQMADYAITSSKLALGAEAGAATDGVLGAAGGTLTFTGTFDYPFAVAPKVVLQSPGWTLGAVSETGFSASIAFAPVEVDNSSSVGTYTSLTVLADGHPAISYSNATAANLVFVRAADASGTAWGTPVTVDSAGNVGNWTSLAVVNGNPAISYRDATAGNQDLKYVRATDASGSAWGTPITIDGVDNVGTYTSLAVVNGRPAIAYHDATNGALKYVQASDPDGTTWGTPVTVDSVAIRKASLKVINGYPAISYFVEASLDLRYVRATDADGAGWGAPVPVDTVGNVGDWTSLEVVNGRPAISYYAPSAGDLRFVRAGDADGNTWDAPLTLDSTGNVGQYTSLAIIDGHPAISYYDVTNGDLKFIQATAADGSAWGTPVSLDGADNVGQWTSLAAVGGNAAISYYDVTNTALKYVTVPTLRWQASDGTVAPLIAASVPPGALGTSVQVGGATQAMVANTSYTATGAAQTAFTLPGTVNVGDTVQVSATGAGGWAVAPGSGQSYVGLWTPHESNRSWQSVASSTDGSKLVAVVNGGQIYTSTDSGANWTARESNRNWWSVASSDDGSKLVAVVNGGQIYTSANSGANWTPQPSAGPRDWWSVVSSDDGSKLVATPQNGQIYTSTDYGATWTQQPLAGNRSWQSVASSTDGSKLVAVVQNGQIYTSTDSGANWTARESNRNWWSVASSDDGSKLVAVVNGGQIYTSTDSGVSWTARLTDANRFWQSVASSADGSKLVAVEQHGQIYTSTDSGANWTTRESSRNWFSVASSADGSKLVAVDRGGQIYTSAPSGAAGSSATLQYLGNGEWTALTPASPLPFSSVSSAQLAPSSVTSSAIADGSVTGIDIASNTITNFNIAGNAGISATKLGTGAVSGTVDNNEFGYLDGVTSGIQGQLDTLTTNLGTTNTNVSNLTTTVNGKVSKAGDTMTGTLTATRLTANSATNGSFDTPFFNQNASHAGLAVQIAGTGTYEPQMRFARADGQFYDIGMNGGNGFVIEDNDTARLTIDSNGHVGIGTTSPTALVTILTAAAEFGFEHGDTSGHTMATFVNGSGGWIGTTSNHPLNFYTNNSNEQVTLSTSGNLGIGTTTPSKTLDVNGTVSISGNAYLRGNQNYFGPNATNSNLAVASFVVRAPAGWDLVAAFHDGNGFPLVQIYDPVVSGDGTTFVLGTGDAAKPGGGSWGVFSDRRLKKNIAPLTGALARLLELHSVTYEYTNPQALGYIAGTQTGFIAQEVEPIFPEWVSTGRDGMKMLNIRGFESLAVQALRELSTEKDEKIAALEKRLTELEAKDAAREKREQEREARLAKLEQFIPKAPESQVKTAAIK